MKKATGFFMAILFTLSFWGKINAQNGIIGSGFGTSNFDWSNTDCFNASASDTRILETTPGGTGNQYFRLVTCWDSNFNQWGPSSTINDLEITLETAVGSSEVVENSTSKAYYINVPNASYKYIFKTRGGGNPPSNPDFIVFEIQGTTQSVSSVSNSVSGNALHGEDVTVTATLDGSFSTGQSVYLRYTDDSFSTSTIVEMSGSGTSYTGTIPGSINQVGTSISYYVFTSGDGLTISHSDADFFTINFNNNSGSNYSYSVTSQVSITGSEGWRILSTPTSNNTYNDLLGGIWTQGIATGADATSGTANVQTFSNSTDSFSGISDMGTTMTPGNGFIVYVYSDDDYTNSGADAGFPKTLSVSGTENTGSVSPTLNGGTSGDDSFSLVGNPYASTIDWDLLTKTDLTGTVYVYDHSYGSVTAPDVSAAVGGGYRVWTGSTGSLTDGLITPFQGFWVQNSGGSAALTIEEADKSSGGTFYKEAKSVNFAFKSEIGNMYDETFFSFDESALLGKDNNDALQLSPLDYRSYMSLASRSDDDLFDVNNLPSNFDEVQIPISVKAYTKAEGGYAEMSGTTKLSWSGLEKLPENWEFLLSDTEMGTTVNLREASEYSFELIGTKSKARTASVLSPLQPTKEKSVEGSDRFVLTISQTTSVNNEEEAKVEGFALSQNYPNPFNPTTTINYSVENAGPVTISIYNLMGQKVAELVNESKAAGSYNVTWNAANAASGMYYYRLESAGQTLTRKMTLIK